MTILFPLLTSSNIKRSSNTLPAESTGSNTFPPALRVFEIASKIHAENRLLIIKLHLSAESYIRIIIPVYCVKVSILHAYAITSGKRNYVNNI